MPDSSPKLIPDVFSVSRRFDMATILVAMVGYSILFGGLRLILQIIPDLSSWAIGTFGMFFAVVAIGQAVAIRWNNPRAASVIAGTIFWLVVVIVTGVLDRPPSYWLCGLLFTSLVIGPIAGYLAGTLVGGVFLISHYLRESNGLRRRVPAEGEDADSPWGVTPSSMPPAEDYEWPHMIEVPPPDNK